MKILAVLFLVLMVVTVASIAMTIGSLLRPENWGKSSNKSLSWFDGVLEYYGPISVLVVLAAATLATLVAILLAIVVLV